MTQLKRRSRGGRSLSYRQAVSSDVAPRAKLKTCNDACFRAGSYRSGETSGFGIERHAPNPSRSLSPPIQPAPKVRPRLHQPIRARDQLDLRAKRKARRFGDLTSGEACAAVENRIDARRCGD